MEEIYWDNNATTQVDGAVLEEMLPWLRKSYGNPSSLHRWGKEAKRAVEDARWAVAELIEAEAGEVVFTSGGTESVQTAIYSAIRTVPERKTIVVSAVEHSATLRACGELEKQGYRVIQVPVGERGELAMEVFKQSLSDEVAVVSLLWANNETGVIFPVGEVAELCAKAGIFLHIDAVQAAGKERLNFSEHPGISYLSISGHKFHAAKGIGALAISKKARFFPLLGGSQEEGRRGGTENVAGIVGMGEAARLAKDAPGRDMPRVAEWRDAFEVRVMEELGDVFRNGRKEERIATTSNLWFAGVDGASLLVLLDRAGLACSMGAACGRDGVSHVLGAMGFAVGRIRSSLRFSLSRLTREEEVERAVEVVCAAVKKVRVVRGAIKG